MACYINPKGGNKEEFLRSFGEIVSFENTVLYHNEAPDPSLLFVTLSYSNSFVTTASIAYSHKEFKKLKAPTTNYTIWFLVPREDLYKVSNLEEYLPRDKVYK